MAYPVDTWGNIASGTGVTSIALNDPTGTNGDRLYLFLVLSGDGQTPGGISGWTEEGNASWDFGGGEYWLWSKDRNSTNDTPTVTWSASRNVSACLVNVSGQDATTPEDDIQFATYGTGGPFEAAAVTSSGAERLWLVFGISRLDIGDGTHSLSNSVTVQKEYDGVLPAVMGSKQVGSGSTGVSEWTSTGSIQRMAFASVCVAPSTGSSASPFFIPSRRQFN